MLGSYTPVLKFIYAIAKFSAVVPVKFNVKKFVYNNFLDHSS